MRRAALFFLVLLPGGAAVVVCAHYLFLDWGKLISAFARFEQATQTGADTRALYVAGTRDMIFRINSFADGVGVMLGAILFGIGVHGLCLLPPRGRSEGIGPPGRQERQETKDERTAVNQSSGRGLLVQLVLAGMAVLAASLLLVSLVKRVGQTNDLRRAVVRGDASGVRTLAAQGVDVNDRLWWGDSPLELARKQEESRHRREVETALRTAGARD